MHDVSAPVIAALAAVAGLGGLIDSIAGGGGLLTVPALLWAGLDPLTMLGTNKAQAVWGSGAALASFWRAKLVDRALAPIGLAMGLAGSLAGANLVRLLAPAVLRPVVLGLLATVAVVLALRPSAVAPDDGAEAPEPARARRRMAGIAFGIGAYDGFFGPGTGTFLIIAFAMALAQPLVRASANAKVVNFASNLAALATFALAGHVAWKIALPMAAAQLVGGTIGARLTSTKGSPLVRRLVVAVALSLCAKLTWDLLRT